MILAAIKLSENTKKALIIFFLIFIIVFVLIGYISMAIESGMKKQGSKADGMLANVVKVEIFTTKENLEDSQLRRTLECSMLSPEFLS